MLDRFFGIIKDFNWLENIYCWCLKIVKEDLPIYMP